MSDEDSYLELNSYSIDDDLGVVGGIDAQTGNFTIDIGNFEAKHVYADVAEYERPRLVGEPVPAFLLSAADPEDPIILNHTVGLAWTMMTLANTAQEAGSLFASSLSVFIPKLRPPMLKSLTDINTEWKVLTVPIDTDPVGLIADPRRLYDNREHMVYLGISLMLPFKNVAFANYDMFVQKRVKALGGMLGLSPESVAKLKYPLSLKHAKLVREVYSGDLEFKREILRYLMWAADDQGMVRNMARYVVYIIAWSDMSLLVFIHASLVVTKSPVLRHASVAIEMNKFVKAMKRICASTCPQFFRFFCTSAEEQLLQRNNFPILGAVATAILKQHSKNQTLDNFAGTTESGSATVANLLHLHNKHAKKYLLGKKNKFAQWLARDGGYDEVIRKEAQRKRLRV